MAPGLSGTLRMFGRFARDLGPFLRRPLTLEDARARIRERLAGREERFLTLVERGVYGHPASPYLPLLRSAGCSLQDLRQAVLRDGLEATLRALRLAGVFVSLEEFKGRLPIERNGVFLEVEAHDFDNPLAARCYEMETGGSTGGATRISTDLAQLEVHASHAAVHLQAHDLLGAPMALWTGGLPDGSGVNNLLRLARIGMPVERWFSPYPPGRLGEGAAFRLATPAIVTMMRLHGSPAPYPETVETEQAGRIARWMRSTLDLHGRCFLKTSVSRCLRVSLAALEAGIDLAGATMCGGGEPITRAKTAGITGCGARFISSYSFSEAGPVALSCARPAEHDEVHFTRDALALISHPRAIPGIDVPVESFHFTTLLPSASKLMLNVELDDSGVIERRACGCPLEEVGLTDHISRIRSFGRLTGEGVSLAGADVVEILEETLPRAFGGSPLDWQLVEEEVEKGLTALTILVDPRLPGVDGERVLEVFLQALGRRGFEGHLSGTTWRAGGNLRVRRQKPILTSRGKHFPIRRAGA